MSTLPKRLVEDQGKLALAICQGSPKATQDRPPLATRTLVAGVQLYRSSRLDRLVAFCKKIYRAKLLPFFADIPNCYVAMEACASAYYWARLIAPIYGRLFVKRI